jgi:hypothetical protein
VEENKNEEYISLFEATKLCSYSEPYLRLRARQGKLKSIKLGKKWMTTAAWIDEYGKRIQEWQKLTEAKKRNLPATALTSAPAEQIIAEELPRPAAILTESTPPLEPPVPKRKKLAMPAGQIYPLPLQKPLRRAPSLGFFGAMVSGAVCALALFLAADPGNAVRMADINHGGAGQANVSRAVDVGAKQNTIPAFSSPQIFESGAMPAVEPEPRSSEYNPLERLVETIAEFLRSL